jgi:hypothetical protein
VLGFMAVLIYKKRYKEIKRLFIYSALSVIAGICFIGYNPYVTNTRDFHHPFYPLNGKSFTENFSFMYQEGVSDKSRVVKLIYAIYGKTENSKAELKIPFTVTKSELVDNAKTELRVGGMGVFYGGVFTLSFLLLMLSIIRRRVEVDSYVVLGIVLVSIFASILIISEPWITRYIPQLWFTPLIILVFLEFCYKLDYVWFRNVTYIIAFINVGLIFCTYFGYNTLMTLDINRQLNILEKSKKEVKVDFGDFFATRVRLEEHNIPYTSVTNMSPDSAYNFADMSKVVKIDASNVPAEFSYKFSQELVDFFKGEKE